MHADLQPEAKLRRVEALLAAIFGRDVMDADRADAPLDMGEDWRARIVPAFQTSAERSGITERARWREALAHWAPGPDPITDGGLLLRVDAFDEMLNQRWTVLPAAQVRPPRPAVAPSEQRRVPRGSGPSFPLSARTAGGDPGHHLTKAEVLRHFGAASFVMQRYGLTFDTWITLRYDEAGRTESFDAGTFVTRLTHELRMRIGERVKLGLGDEPVFHWLYTHEDDPVHGRSTHLVATVPEKAGNIERWLRDAFLPSDFPGALQPRTLEFDRRAFGDAGRRVQQHWAWVRRLCRGLLPSARERISERGRKTESLVRLLKVSEPAPIGPKFTAQRVGRSRTLDRKAHAIANAEFKVLSAIESRAWDRLDEGWELQDHQERQRFLAERAKARRVIDEEFPRKDVVSRRRHVERVQAFDREWDARARLARVGLG